jgi:hypothetical protein
MQFFDKKFEAPSISKSYLKISCLPHIKQSATSLRPTKTIHFFQIKGISAVLRTRRYSRTQPAGLPADVLC